MREAPEKQTDRTLCSGFWAEHVRYSNVRVFGVFRGQNHQKSGSLSGIFLPWIDTDDELRSSGTDIRVGGKAAIRVYPW